ncbi:SDR family NAD(P)-dependent oxidoreductase [Emticicia sp. 21SJ11W-3]|uniref:SDR family NAD(P)-dependent oxidoreductase n=1 Tax=Emticicia sp. 21SJ11W-3 TaxID=2916755 RepID=UPI00209CF03F|nr:SDR family oxidoreductase [Emticicia sp. 21SJ11W-3]UTA66737.1 SDR family oxidoreductase [Emticicia sp. 21SJ11W-3]
MNNIIQDLFGLQNKTAIVTGGAMGIGKGIATRLALAGASVLIADIVSEQDAAPTVDGIRQQGGKVAYIQADLSNTALLPGIVKAAVDTFGDIDILVNNAGIFKYMPITELNEDLWDKTLNINLKAVAFLSKAFINTLIEKKHGGKIINISSIDSLKPTGNLAQYDASKGGIRMLTRSFAKEAGKYGITVNDIAPGGVNTPGVQKIAGDNLPKEQLEAMQAQTAQFIQTLPLQRIGEPDDIGNAALFLAGKASDYITGSTIVVDGGLLLM